jgi:hypothetical protein
MTLADCEICDFKISFATRPDYEFLFLAFLPAISNAHPPLLARLMARGM